VYDHLCKPGSLTCCDCQGLRDSSLAAPRNSELLAMPTPKQAPAPPLLDALTWLLLRGLLQRGLTAGAPQAAIRLLKSWLQCHAVHLHSTKPSGNAQIGTIAVQLQSLTFSRLCTAAWPCSDVHHSGDDQACQAHCNAYA
jgi:hypothetical protein